jgi:hypothetical protein
MNSFEADIHTSLKDYVPVAALSSVAKLVLNYGFHLKITKPRNTKLGDYRAPHGDNGHRITINGNLNQYAFLLVFLHEVAHLIVQEKHGRKVLPHGQEWKYYFRDLTLPYLNPEIFPPALLRVVAGHMKNPKASTSGDPQLTKALRMYDDGDILKTVDDMELGQNFTLKNGRVFQKGERQRTRHKCIEITSGKNYLVSGSAEVVSTL